MYIMINDELASPLPRNKKHDLPTYLHTKYSFYCSKKLLRLALLAASHIRVQTPFVRCLTGEGSSDALCVPFPFAPGGLRGNDGSTRISRYRPLRQLSASHCILRTPLHLFPAQGERSVQPAEK